MHRPGHRPPRYPDPARPYLERGLELGLGLILCLLASACFPRGPGARLAEFPELAPAVGAPLPAVTLVHLDGEPLVLAERVADRPLVLQVGSVSCPVFRYRRHGMERLARDYADRVDFVVVYTQEAHPVGAPSPYTEDEWDPWINRIAGVRVDDAETEADRRTRATRVRDTFELTADVVVDPPGDAAWNALGRAPSSAFVIDRDGRVVFRQVWVRPKALRRVLSELLDEERPRAP